MKKTNRLPCLSRSATALLVLSLALPVVSVATPITISQIREDGQYFSGERARHRSTFYFGAALSGDGSSQHGNAGASTAGQSNPGPLNGADAIVGIAGSGVAGTSVSAGTAGIGGAGNTAGGAPIKVGDATIAADPASSHSGIDATGAGANGGSLLSFDLVGGGAHDILGSGTTASASAGGRSAGSPQGDTIMIDPRTQPFAGSPGGDSMGSMAAAGGNAAETIPTPPMAALLLIGLAAAAAARRLRR